MTKEAQIQQLEARIKKMQHTSKDNEGVQRKLRRQIRNLQK